LAKGREGDVPRTALDAANVGPVKVGYVGKLFLRPARRLPPVADALAKYFQISIMHTGNVAG
jgi:hypothetical protein